MADPSLREKVGALRRVITFRPGLTLTILAFSLAAAMLEGVGIGYILPIIDQAGGSESVEGNGGQLLQLFEQVYTVIGVPFSLEYLLIGVGAVMVIRHSLSFTVDWLRARLSTDYIRTLRREAFDRILSAETSYLEDRGVKTLVDAIVTQTKYPANVLATSISFTKQLLVCLVYLGIALYLAPVLTLLAAGLMGGITFLIRFVIEPAYASGDRLASANEWIQERAQSGVHGARTVKLFGLHRRMLSAFEDAIDHYSNARVTLRRNRSLMDNGHRLASVLVVFGMVYLALVSPHLSLASAGVFLFALFRLAPRVSRLNGQAYYITGNLPHLVRTLDLISELDRHQEADDGDRRPDHVSEIAFDGVTFTYDDGTPAVEDVSFTVERGEFVAFVGPSGSGKSTIVSLLAGLRRPDSGVISAGQPIDRFDLEKWRDRIAVVRQDPYIFDETVRYNVGIGDPAASESEIERVCELAAVTEFIDGLPHGYDTVLGDDGVKLSGGQRQRIAIARALLRDADVLVLDEATSDLDTVLEAAVYQSIESMDGERIVIAITHRLSTVVEADRIFTVENGRITDVGSHDALIAADGTYSQLFSVQSSEV